MEFLEVAIKTNEKVASKNLFQTAVQLDPNLKEAKEGLERVK